MKSFIFVVLAFVLLYIGGCSAISASKTHKFESIRYGDSKGAVLVALGEPDVVESSGEAFTRYASAGCSERCIERLWYENRLGLDIEAWSVEIDDAGKVIHKTHWTSP